MKELTGALTLRRAAAFGKAKAAVESPRYRSLLLDTLQWLENGDWAKHPGFLWTSTHRTFRRGYSRASY